ncbi:MULTISPECIES: HAMP domain-containing sensor histidine kinase [Pseudomonadota]|jgi:signal transduction histidine kinase|uniref:sensor histidine kinase n=1 Tax=Pseudomonadota TaxID=1224 RepID=UPI00076AC492|nr:MULTISPECIES: HAMP domain-containing sensor histidine kinase [Pseudomonadota]MAF63761.1 sensor histidine kinase [Blastomonas sp.]MBA4228808.1 sensor histidine kinase [Hyphomonas sp.]|tara:strand:- start:36479 stop:37492 length:1014 start_codon:yes stop_codon:yes gene_type:complete
MSRQPTSIFKSLARGLAVVGLGGTVFLLVAVLIEYRISFAEMATANALEAALHEMVEHVLLPVVALVVPMTAAALFVMRRAFKPLTDATEQLNAITGRDRNIRIDDHKLPTEVRPFTVAVNTLLGRLEQSALHQEAFAADVAHELRTPLAAMVLELDGMTDPAAARLKGDVAAMRRLIDQLMLLAQMDAQEAAATATDDVDLADVASDVVARCAPAVIAQGRTIELVNDGQRLVIRGRREAIAAALRNLIDNAVRVTPNGGTVHVVLDGTPAIRVIDGGPGLSLDQLTQLIQRNRRADYASPDGAGLGLAIVDRIMQVHRGAIRTDPENSALILDFS